MVLMGELMMSILLSSIYPPNKHVNIQVIGNNNIKSVPIDTIGALDHSKIGTIFIIMHQYSYLGKWETIHYYVQLECYKNDIKRK